MSIFGSKIELSKKIRELAEELEQKEIDNNQLMHQISGFKSQLEHIMKQNEEYEAKYIHTNLECSFCYNIIQENYEYCPKCGKKIVKDKKENCIEVTSSIFKTEQDGDSLLINQYTGFNDKKIVIPSSINGKPIIGIWNGVFEKCTALEEIYIEEGCKYIGKNVFANCINLKRVHLPKSLLEIGDGAFQDCGIEEVAIPPNIKVLGTKAFSTRSLKKIVLPEGLKFISNQMLLHTAIEEICIPKSVSYIGTSAFCNTKLKMVELPPYVRSINSSAFDIDCLEKITIHSNVKNMGTHILGYENKSNAIIYCASGSKAQLYARKYGLECREISQQPVSSANSFAETIVVEFGSYTKEESLKNWYKNFGFCKAETWSWEYKGDYTIHITKIMEMKDAEYIRAKIRSFANSYGDWSKPGIHCTIMKLDIWSCGETSDV